MSSSFLQSHVTLLLSQCIRGSNLLRAIHAIFYVTGMNVTRHPISIFSLTESQTLATADTERLVHFMLRPLVMTSINLMCLMTWLQARNQTFWIMFYSDEKYPQL